MGGETGNPTTTMGSAQAAAPSGIPMAGSAGAPAASAGSGGGTLMVAEGADDLAAESEGRDTRLDRLPMQLDVMVRVQSMRVQDLLSLEKGSVVESVHEHSQDLPVQCGGALLVWGEFEVVDQKLAVRITRLA